MTLRIFTLALLVATCATLAIGQSAKEVKKEMLRRSCESEVSTTPDKLKALIIDEMTENGRWDLSSDSQFKITFSRSDNGKAAFGLMLGSQMGGANPSQPMANVYFTFVPREATTTVRCRFDLSYDVKSGRTVYAEGFEKDDKIMVLGVLDRITAR